jgi:hypothetical protein
MPRCAPSRATRSHPTPPSARFAWLAPPHLDPPRSCPRPPSPHASAPRRHLAAHLSPAQSLAPCSLMPARLCPPAHDAPAGLAAPAAGRGATRLTRTDRCASPPRWPPPPPPPLRPMGRQRRPPSSRGASRRGVGSGESRSGEAKDPAGVAAVAPPPPATASAPLPLNTGPTGPRRSPLVRQAPAAAAALPRRGCWSRGP